MKPDASEAGRAALAATHRRLQLLGVPQAIRFRRPDGFGFDEFTLVYPDHTLLVGIMLDSEGRLLTSPALIPASNFHAELLFETGSIRSGAVD